MAAANRPGQSREAGKYFLTGFVFLALLALFSSLGAAFVYIFLGAAVYFMFLGIMRVYDSSVAAQSHFRPTGTSAAPDFLTSLSMSLNRMIAEIRYRKSRQVSFSPQELAKKIIRVVVISFSVFIGLIIMIGIFSGTGEAEYLAEGDYYYNNGNYDSAAILYRKALDENPSSFAAFTALGRAFSTREMYDSAYYYYDAAVQMDPDASEAHQGKAASLYNLRRYDDALVALQWLFENDEYNGWAYLLGGDCYYVRQNYNDAIPLYERAYELGQRSKDLSHIMAYIYDSQSKPDKAIAFYEEALAYGENAEISQRLRELKSK